MDNTKKSAVKSTINAVLTSIENIHGQWIINENMNTFKGADGAEHNLNDNGYPEQLDEGANTSRIFSYVIKNAVPACSNTKAKGCWKEPSTNEYEYYFNENKILKIDYKPSEGTFECKEGTNFTEEECNETIFG
ncbi:MAG: hypothetical protein ABGX25_03935 [Nautiliaceae bacterium]